MIDTNQIEQTPRTIEKVDADPAHVADKGTVYPKEVGGKIELFYIDEAGIVTQITTNGSLSLPAIPSLVPAGGSVGTILSKASAVDYATQWSKLHQLMGEFYFKLPLAATLGARILALGTVSGMTLNTAQNDPSPEAEFGSSPDTLVVAPVGLSGIVATELSVMELTTVGADIDKGWTVLNGATLKTNSAMTKASLIEFGNILDASKDVLIRIRFIKTVMP